MSLKWKRQKIVQMKTPLANIVLEQGKECMGTRPVITAKGEDTNQ